MIAKACEAIFSEEEKLTIPQLKENDINVYYKDCITDINMTSVVNFNMIEYNKVDDLDREIDTIKYEGLNTKCFLANNDLNVTTSCFQVHIECDDFFTVHASPCFWGFLF